MERLSRYSAVYIHGKASKVKPGKYHLVITQNNLASYSRSVGKVYRLHIVKRQGPYGASVRGTRKFPNQYHEGMIYLWFQQPSSSFCDCILDVFPLDTEDQDEADKLGAELFELIIEADKLGLYKKYKS